LFESREDRLKKILKADGHTLLIAFDHAVEHGPAAYEGIDLDPRRIARIALEGGADGIIVHAGAAKAIKPIVGDRLPIIIKLTGRTSLAPSETEVQQLVTTVEEAKALGATAVAATLYVGADRESEMLRLIAEIKRDCLELQMPLLGFAYPRSRKKSKYDAEAICYAARVGAEIGFDIVKTYYPGNREDWAKAVKASFAPVVAAGGPALSNAEDVIKVVQDIMSVGAAGIAFGRNIWSRDDATAIALLKQIRAIIHGRSE